MRPMTLVLALVLALATLSSTPVAQSAQNPCTAANLHPNSSTLPPGNVGQPYLVHVWLTPASLCIPPMWSSNPSPPFPGVQLVPGMNGNDAWIVGVPSATGTYTFTVTAGGTWVCGTICFLTQTWTVTVT